MQKRKKEKKKTHSRIFLQLQARSLETQTYTLKIETEVNEEWGYMCHIISNAKDQLKHVFPYINYKKRKGAFSKYAQRLLSYF